MLDKKNPDSENIAKIKVACKVDTLQLQNCGCEPPSPPPLNWWSGPSPLLDISEILLYFVGINAILSMDKAVGVWSGYSHKSTGSGRQKKHWIRPVPYHWFAVQNQKKYEYKTNIPYLFSSIPYHYCFTLYPLFVINFPIFLPWMYNSVPAGSANAWSKSKHIHINPVPHYLDRPVGTRLLLSVPYITTNQYCICLSTCFRFT